MSPKSIRPLAAPLAGPLLILLLIAFAASSARAERVDAPVPPNAPADPSPDSNPGWRALDPTLLWAGYQVVEGTRTLPVIGTLKTRTRTWFLARLRPAPADGALDPGPATWVLAQRTCGVKFDSVMGVKIRLPDRALARMPVTTAPFQLDPDGLRARAEWETGWDASDLDGDGKPGVTIEVGAAMCSGDLQVASHTHNHALARVLPLVPGQRGPQIEGSLRVRVRQEILGASGACLRAASEDTDETLSGSFHLTLVDPDATCGRWTEDTWPARLASAARARALLPGP